MLFIHWKPPWPLPLTEPRSGSTCSPDFEIQPTIGFVDSNEFPGICQHHLSHSVALDDRVVESDQNVYPRCEQQHRHTGQLRCVCLSASLHRFSDSLCHIRRVVVQHIRERDTIEPQDQAACQWILGPAGWGRKDCVVYERTASCNSGFQARAGRRASVLQRPRERATVDLLGFPRVGELSI